MNVEAGWAVITAAEALILGGSAACYIALPPPHPARPAWAVSAALAGVALLAAFAAAAAGFPAITFAGLACIQLVLVIALVIAGERRARR